METPLYVDNIPTEKHATKERREIIKKEYIRFLD